MLSLLSQSYTIAVPSSFILCEGAQDSKTRHYPLNCNDVEKIHAFLRSTLESEGHFKATRGMTVNELALSFVNAWRYDATGEEIRAVMRLLELGRGSDAV